MLTTSTTIAASPSMCGHGIDLVIHRGSVERHTWEGTAEHLCGCQPVTLCARCHNPDIRSHAFIVGAAEWFRDFAPLPGQAVN